MAGIFVSYRRDDSQGFAGRLADDLSQILGPDRVFRDIEIPLGSDFTDVLQRAVAACDILLVVIGRHWSADSEQGYRSRLFEPTDWVRTEIEAAFVQKKHVIPILVGGADMPGPETLPHSIEQLSRQQAATLTDRHWSNEVANLADHLGVLCPSIKEDLPKNISADQSPAEVLSKLGERLIDEVVLRNHRGTNVPHSKSTFGHRLLQNLGRKIRSLITVIIVLGLIYMGIRLFGDDALLSNLNALEARLQIGWGRLLHYIESL
ncbi:MAG: toll/interleukin-1 receptor domain-containing protein [Candidatus Thiodiazotropha sp. (ex Codakia rugifera)]|nr:toll/interleukin-1 receptor domain-containing protein [Candidatus Thiodiazotropha sp. (ex Codakia rugifera)]